MAAATPPRAPKGHWLAGHSADLIRDQLGYFTRLAREYGDFIPLRLTAYRAAFLNHPDLIEEVLVTRSRSFVKSLLLRRLNEVVGEGLLTSSGELWRRQRRLIQPAFHRQRVAEYGRAMVERTERLIASWRDGQEYDIHQAMTRLTLDVVCETLFGAEVDAEAEGVAAAFTAALRAYEDQINSLELFFPHAIPTPSRLRSRRAVRRLEALIFRMIEERRASAQPRGDLLSILLEACDEEDGAGMADRQVRDELMTLLLVGHETTALALTWAWYLLAQRAEAEARLHAELRQVLGGRAPTPTDLPALTYTGMVISEALRLYPPAWVIAWDAIEETRIGEHRIAKGTIVIMSPWTMHRDPRYFEDPEAFRPERWADGLASRLPRFAYFPFSGGPRACIGSSYALLEANLILATIAQRFRLVTVPGQVITPEPVLTLRPRHGIRMTLVGRD